MARPQCERLRIENMAGADRRVELVHPVVHRAGMSGRRLRVVAAIRFPPMALPADVKDEAVRLVAAYCATKIPSEHADKIRIEYKVRGNTITIFECRPPWREDFGPDWTSMRICSLQWDPETRLWALYARDRNDRRLDYPYLDPAPTVAPLLHELESDPTCIFWG